LITPDQMAATHAAAFAQDRPWSAAEFADFLAQRLCFVTGDPRCFALVRVLADEAELLTLATDPEHQRRGLARAVMAGWMAEAGRRGAARAWLEVAADNAAAVALYAAMGFAVRGRRRGYYRRHGLPAVDALVMACDLHAGSSSNPEPDGQESG
jgi:ribosomal-protein-alanine N-acetyltransferase